MPCSCAASRAFGDLSVARDSLRSRLRLALGLGLAPPGPEPCPEPEALARPACPRASVPRRVRAPTRGRRWSSNPWNRADVRMIQRGQHLRFPLEPREALGIASERGWQDLDRDIAIELGIARAVDLAHPAHTKQTVDPEHPDLCADCASSKSPRVEGRSVAARSINAASVPDFRRDSTSARNSASFAHSESSAVGRSDSAWSTPRRRCATPRASGQVSWCDTCPPVGTPMKDQRQSERGVASGRIVFTRNRSPSADDGTADAPPPGWMMPPGTRTLNSGAG